MVDLLKDSPSIFKLSVLLLAAILLAIQCVGMDGPGVVIDDAFISFRYAKHVSNGQGLVFNIGERVEGYTNFLWVVLLAFSHRLGLNIVLASKLWAFASGLISLVLILLTADYLFEVESSPWIIAMPSVLFAAMPSQARYVVSGMETLLFTCLLTGSIYLFLTKRYLLSGLTFALTAMTRPEGTIYFATTFTFGFLVPKIFNGEKVSLKDIAIFTLAFTLVYGSYFYWRYHYFGYLLPNTYYAKASGFYLTRFSRGWSILIQVLDKWRVLPLLTLGLFSSVSISTDKDRVLFISLILVTFIYFIWVGGDFVAWFGPRFLTPVLPLMLLLAAQGTQNISLFLLAGRPLGKYIFRFTVLMVLSINTFCFSWAANFSANSPFSIKMRGWSHLGRWLANNTSPDSMIATDATGIIPYYSNRYSIDMFGLTEEHIAHLDKPVTEESIAAHEKYAPRYILKQEPDYIVSTWLNKQGEAVSAGLELVHREIKESYKLVAVAKVSEGIPTNGQWIIETTDYNESLYEAGYLSGVFQRCPQ